MSSTINASTASGGGVITTADASGILQLQTAGTTALTIDGSQNVGIGTASPTPTNASTIAPKLVVTGAGVVNGIQSVRTGGGGGGGAQLILSSTKGADANTYTALVSSEGIGTLSFNGSDGTRFIPAATIVSQVDGAVSTDNVLGRLVFGTSAGGANSVIERMRIDSSGNVGIGTSSPSGKLHVQNSTNAILVEPAGTWAAKIYQAQDTTAYNGLVVGNRWAATTSTVFEAGSLYGAGSGSWKSFYKIDGAGTHVWGNNTSEVMRIDTNGYLLKNTSAFINTSYGNGDFSLVTMSAGLVIKNPGAAGSSVPTSIVFLNGAGTAVGYIAVGASVTNFTNLSDYRLKKDVTQINNALDKVSRINPVSFIWKESGEIGESFIAHELQEECPIAVVGNKDDVNEDGSIRPQGVDASKLIPLLTAAIKELKAIIDTQNARIEALEGVK